MNNKDDEQENSNFDTNLPYTTDVSIAEDEFIQFVRKVTDLNGEILLDFELICDVYCYTSGVREESLKSLVTSLIRKQIIVNNKLILLGIANRSQTQSEFLDYLLNDKIPTGGVNLFEVYTVYDTKGKCLYVGEGKRNRHLHTLSGRSHVYELNELHFKGVELIVSVVQVCDTKAEARDKESELILLLKPSFNKRIPN